MLFPVQRPGEDITAEWELFFSFCNFFHLFFRKKKDIFLPKKRRGKKDIAAAQLATISATRWTGNNIFFKGGLMPFCWPPFDPFECDYQRYHVTHGSVYFRYEPFLTREFPCPECTLDVNPEYHHLLYDHAV